MISIIIPTKNRSYTLVKVLDSYYCQKHVDEIIIIDDGNDEETRKICESFSKKYPKIKSIYIANVKPLGANLAKSKGVDHAKNDYILFGEDDTFLKSDYTEVLLNYFNDPNVVIASGRIIYMQPDESIEHAENRFGNGLQNLPYFNKASFALRRDSIVEKDTLVPFTHALFITKKKYFKHFPIDNFYSKGNGFREETDFQMNVFSNGFDNILSNKTRCFHLHMKNVKTGGQRRSRFKIFYWNIYYTFYFFDKHYNNVKQRLDLKNSIGTAKMIYVVNQFYTLFIRPFRHFFKFQR